MKKFGFIIMVLCLATSAFAFGPNDDDGKHKNIGKHENGRQPMERRFDHCSEFPMGCDVELTQEQKDKMSDIHKKHRDEVFDIRTDIQKTKVDQRVNLKKHDFAKAKANAKKINALRGQIEDLKIDMMEDCYNVLTKEQKAKL